jgi:hypothetical protein
MILKNPGKTIRQICSRIPYEYWRDNPDQLIRLKGILQFSEVLCVGYRIYDNQWEPEDKLVAHKPNWDFDPDVNEYLLDKRELEYVEPHKIIYWLYTSDSLGDKWFIDLPL